MAHNYFVYILATQKNGTFYIGVTNDLLKRIQEHKAKTTRGFSTKYSIDRLVYYEQTADIYIAIGREKQLKNWKRAWKIQLINRFNPKWLDLYNQIQM